MNKQKIILAAFKDPNEILTMDEIFERTNISYYYNERKHLGDRLGRLVDIQILTRIKPGHFKINPNYKIEIKKEEVDPDQMGMF